MRTLSSAPAPGRAAEMNESTIQETRSERDMRESLEEGHRGSMPKKRGHAAVEFVQKSDFVGAERALEPAQFVEEPLKAHAQQDRGLAFIPTERLLARRQGAR